MASQLRIATFIEKIKAARLEAVEAIETVNYEVKLEQNQKVADDPGSLCPENIDHWHELLNEAIMTKAVLSSLIHELERHIILT